MENDDIWYLLSPGSLFLGMGSSVQQRRSPRNLGVCSLALHRAGSQAVLYVTGKQNHPKRVQEDSPSGREEGI